MSVTVSTTSNKQKTRETQNLAAILFGWLIFTYFFIMIVNERESFGLYRSVRNECISYTPAHAFDENAK